MTDIKPNARAMTEHDKALVERLRSVDVSWSETGEWCAEAADRIEQLEREKAVVSDLWEQQKEIALDYLTDCNKAADCIEAQAAEIEKLREALRDLLDLDQRCGWHSRQADAARAALGEQQ